MKKMSASSKISPRKKLAMGIGDRFGKKSKVPMAKKSMKMASGRSR